MSYVFVAGGTGYIGSRFVTAARNAGLDMCVLTRSQSSVEQLRSMGVHALAGDLSQPGAWQDEAQKADLAIFIAAPPSWGKKVTEKIAQRFRDGLGEITTSFFHSLNPQCIEKVVYVAGTSYYGDTGITPASEDRTPSPTGWGPYLVPAVHAVQEFTKQGFPTLIAFPGMVYGPESWFPQLILEPLHKRKPIYGLKGYEPIISPVHVEDCGRALLHLLLHGESGQNYFIADDKPMTMRKLTQLSSDITGIPFKEKVLPAWLCKMILGPVLTEYAMANTMLSNEKLKKLGFELKYPTVHDGLDTVILAWREKNKIVSGD